MTKATKEFDGNFKENYWSFNYFILHIHFMLIYCIEFSRLRYTNYEIILGIIDYWVVNCEYDWNFIRRKFKFRIFSKKFQIQKYLNRINLLYSTLILDNPFSTKFTLEWIWKLKNVKFNLRKQHEVTRFQAFDLLLESLEFVRWFSSFLLEILFRLLILFIGKLEMFFHIRLKYSSFLIWNVENYISITPMILYSKKTFKQLLEF